MFKQFVADIKVLRPFIGTHVWWSDPLWILTLQRLRGVAKAYHVPLVPHMLRVIQTAGYGIEIASDVTLGQGVWFIHPVGIVIGGNSQVGDACRFFGSNTLGQSREDGYPVLGRNVWVGAGARILGPICIGDNTMVAANAVVLHNIPANSVAAGAPAKVYPKSAQLQEVTGGI